MRNLLRSCNGPEVSLCLLGVDDPEASGLWATKVSSRLLLDFRFLAKMALMPWGVSLGERVEGNLAVWDEAVMSSGGGVVGAETEAWSGVPCGQCYM